MTFVFLAQVALMCHGTYIYLLRYYVEYVVLITTHHVCKFKYAPYQSLSHGQQMSSKVPQLKIGQLVSAPGFGQATVRFVGEAEFSHGLWVGLEL